MKNFLKEYFYFNKSERKGIFVLLIILLVLLGVYFLMPLFISHEQPDLTAFKADIEKFEASVINPDTNAPIENMEIIQPTLFPFDPNISTKEELIQLGIKEKTATTIINYRNKGGKFKTKEDLKKIYGMQEELFTTLLPYITIAANTPNEKEKPQLFLETKVKMPTRFKIDINAADSIELLKVNGIGPAFAKRIIKYRNKLGGFIAIEQLKEVFGIDSIKYNQIFSSFIVDPEAVKKLKLNSCSDKELGSHPYIGYKLGNIILNYRKQHGGFKSIQELKTINVISDEALNKISPYLSLQ